MRVVLSLFLVMSLYSCKTAGSNAKLYSEANTKAEQNKNSAVMAGDYEFIGGYSETKDSYGNALQRMDIKNGPTQIGAVTMGSDGTYTLTINFAAGASRAGNHGPGVLVSINPASKPKVEQYTVGTAGWVGDDSTEERKIETTENFEVGDPDPGITLSQRVSMFSRPYKWFSKNPWKAYKTITTKITLTTEALKFSSFSDETGAYKDYMQLNFRRKK